MPTLKQVEPNRHSRILGYGAARPDLIVTNDDIAGPIDSSDEWIVQRTGIKTRHRASEKISVTDLAVGAAQDALAAALLFHFLDVGYLAWFLLWTVLALPAVSLLLALPALAEGTEETEKDKG